jgi:RNA polymerase sigma factor (sigma-70 family)
MHAALRSRAGPFSGQGHEHLLKQIKSRGPPGAFDALWERHERCVWAWVKAWAWHASLQAADVRDARQEVYVRWHVAVLKCNPAVARSGKLLAWLHPVLRHDFLDYLRSLWSQAGGRRARAARPTTPPHPSIEPVDYGSDPAAVLEWGERLQAVWHALQALPQQLRYVAEHWSLGASLPEIARECGLSYEEVRWLWDRARLQLRAGLHGLGDGQPTSPRPHSLQSPLLCDAADSMASLLVSAGLGLATMTYG